MCTVTFSHQTFAQMLKCNSHLRGHTHQNHWLKRTVLIQSDSCLKHNYKIWINLKCLLLFSHDQLITLKNHWDTSSRPEHLKRGPHLHLHRAGSIRLEGSQLLFVWQVCGLTIPWHLRHYCPSQRVLEAGVLGCSRPWGSPQRALKPKHDVPRAHYETWHNVSSETNVYVCG